MTIEDIGELEKEIKGSFGKVVELVYSMMLARWMDRRKRPDEWWASLQLCKKKRVDHEGSLGDFPDNFSDMDAQINDTQHTCPDVVELNENVQDATDAESVEHKKIGRSRVQLSAVRRFRRPSTVKFVNPASASKDSTVTMT